MQHQYGRLPTKRVTLCSESVGSCATWERGFTLLEMLVVILLTGMITTILFQGLSQVFRLQTHFDAELDHQRIDTMSLDWYRQVVKSIQPDFPDGKNKFRGTAKEMSGIASNALSLEAGVEAFRLSLDYNADDQTTSLNYKGHGKPVTLITWPGNKGLFRYQDDQQIKQDSWPPLNNSEARQVPPAIWLEAYDKQADATPTHIIVTPMGLTKSRPRVSDMFRQ